MSGGEKFKDDVIKKVIEYVKNRLKNEPTGHDWWHAYRVWKMSLKLSQKEENVDLFVVQLAALLHDIADWKFHGGDSDIGPSVARELLEKLGVDDKTITHVSEIIRNISYKGPEEKNKISSIEGKIVQDADRLDAMGAIGIARAFAYGGYMKRMIYDPETESRKVADEEYIKGDTSTINHFYEKLLLLKDLMNTDAAREIAEKRHEFMEQFLERFYREWEGKE